MSGESDEVTEIWLKMAARLGRISTPSTATVRVPAARLLLAFDALLDEIGPRELSEMQLLDAVHEALAQAVIKAICVSGSMMPLTLLKPEGREDVRSIAKAGRRSIEFMAESETDYWPLPDLRDPRELALAAFAFEAFVGSGGGFLPPRKGAGIH